MLWVSIHDGSLSTVGALVLFPVLIRCRIWMLTAQLLLQLISAVLGCRFGPWLEAFDFLCDRFILYS